MGLSYRIRQFWRTIFVKTDPQVLERAKALLSPDQWELFTQLQPAEMGHALSIYRQLTMQDEGQPDLLVAALLHDVGKLRYRLNPMERAMVVITKAVMPGQLKQSGTLPSQGWESLPGWRKAFVVAEQHAAWGAEMARTVGVTPLAETLIREHHHPHAEAARDTENALLHKLWLVDNES